MIRVVLLGDSFAGKTSIFDKLIYGKSHESFCTTISPSFGNYLDKYIIYDTPGQKRWLNFAKPYIAVADAAIIVYSVEKGYSSVNKWKQILLELNGKDIPVLQVGNKNDLKTTYKNKNVIYISCKRDTNLQTIFQPFFDSLETNPKISVGWMQYISLLFPKVEDVIDHLPGCLQQ
mgnify:CR=1 FL=1